MTLSECWGDRPGKRRHDYDSDPCLRPLSLQLLSDTTLKSLNNPSHPRLKKGGAAGPRIPPMRGLKVPAERCTVVEDSKTWAQ